MLDRLEAMEAAAECRYDEMTAGLPEGKYRCGCGRVANLDDAASISPNPYADPICGFCFEQWKTESEVGDE